MYDDHNEFRQRRELERAQAAADRVKAQLAELQRKARSAKNRLASTTKAEGWHRNALAFVDRQAGYTGEMASARLWLREQSFGDYVALLGPVAATMPDATNIAIEVAAVCANREAWQAAGDALLLAREREAYVADCAAFEAWQREHPRDVRWRDKPATRRQWFLVTRTAEALEIVAPAALNRGTAYDWLREHGANLRLAETATGIVPDTLPGIDDDDPPSASKPGQLL